MLVPPFMAVTVFLDEISYVCYLLVVSIHFLKKSNTYRLKPYFSIRDLFVFAKFSLKTNSAGLCMFVVSVAFTKAILLFMGSDYLIANTVLCAMLEIYQIMNGPSEAAEYLFATYTGEKNGEGIKILFKEALTACVFIGMIFSLLLLLRPNLVLMLYGIEDSPFGGELIKCIRYCSVGLIAASVGGFLSDYYGDTEKPLWSCMMVAFRTALFPILFCVTFILDGGIVGMGIGMLLAQIVAVAVFFTPQLVRLVADDPAVYETSLEYFRAMRFYPLLDVFDTFMFAYVLYRRGYLHFYSAIICRIGINVFLSWQLGMSMGVTGIGLASIISLVVALSIKLTFLFSSKHGLKFVWHLNLRDVLEVAILGFPESAILQDHNGYNLADIS